MKEVVHLKKNKNNKILISSIFIIIIISFVPGIGNRIEGDYYYFGFPAEWLGYYGDYDFSFNLWSFILNIITFYLMILMLNKMYVKIVPNKK